MLVSQQAKHSYAWLPRKCDYPTDRHTDRQTDRHQTKWSLCAAMLRRRHCLWSVWHLRVRPLSRPENYYYHYTNLQHPENLKGDKIKLKIDEYKHVNDDGSKVWIGFIQHKHHRESDLKEVVYNAMKYSYIQHKPFNDGRSGVRIGFIQHQHHREPDLKEAVYNAMKYRFVPCRYHREFSEIIWISSVEFLFKDVN